MKWFILVIFLQQPNIYVFTDPTFESEDQCVGSITDPQFYPTLVAKLIQEYQQPFSIRNVLCIDEKELKDVLTELSSRSA